MKKFFPLILVALFVWTSQKGFAAVVVSPANMNGWAAATINGSTVMPDPSAGTVQFVNGPGTPPLGVGSVNLATSVGGGDGVAMIGTSALDGLPLSAITSLSYSTWMTTNNGQQFPYVAVAFASTGSGPADDNIIFEPPYQTASTGNPGLLDQGATVMSKWQTWNAVAGGWWDGNGIAGTPGTGVVSLATVLAAYPNAVIADFGSPYSSFLGLEFQVGFGSQGETENGNVDNVTIGVNGINTTYDFEPSATPEPASLAIWSLLGVATSLGYYWRRGRKIAVAE